MSGVTRKNLAGWSLFASIVFQLLVAGPAHAGAAHAREWLRAQARPLDRSTGGSSSLTPAREYGYEETGPISGSYTLDPSRPVVRTSPVIVASPSAFPPGYEGPISGSTASLPPGHYVVRGYLMSDTEYLQAEVPVSPQGTWSLEAVGRGGAWRFKLFDAVSGQQLGSTWKGLEVWVYAVTDAEYFLGVAPAYNGAWSFPWVPRGNKLVRLYEAEATQTTALWGAPRMVRSFQLEPGDAGYGTAFEQRTYVYDQALAILAELDAGNVSLAVEMAEALARTQSDQGAFPQWADQLRPFLTDGAYRSGSNGWAAYALAKVIEAAPMDARRPRLQAALAQALQYLAGLQHGTTGLIRGGDEVSWFSTEHNIDCWFAFLAASRVLGNATYLAVADRIQAGLMTHAWDASRGSFVRGGHWATGTRDEVGALDVYSWGAMALMAWNDTARAASSLVRMEQLYGVQDGGRQGYTPYSAMDNWTPAYGEPYPTPTLWFEGSFGAVLATRRMGGNPAALHAGLADAQLADGSFRYATVADPANDIATYRSVASVAWFLFNEVPATRVWNERR
jgi:hypothetical protein